MLKIVPWYVKVGALLAALGIAFLLGAVWYAQGTTASLLEAARIDKEKAITALTEKMTSQAQAAQSDARARAEREEALSADNERLKGEIDATANRTNVAITAPVMRLIGSVRGTHRAPASKRPLPTKR